MLPENKRLRPRVLPLIIRDAAAAAVVLIVFALFHHALPRSGRALESIVDSDGAPAQTSVTLEIKPQAVTALGTAPAPSSVLYAADTAAPSFTAYSASSVAPSSAAYAEGDFSAVFPSFDTGAGALYSYQSDTLRIAVNRVQAGDITYYTADVWVRSISGFRTAFAKGEYGTSL